MNGILNIFKPKGMTSHDVVRRVRKILNIKKVGHTGTLDPGASGVLPICIGKATRVSEYFLKFRKTYIAELTLGYKTDTQDVEGNIVNSSEKTVTKEQIFNVFSEFKGSIYQVPPMYSALKYKGKKLYEIARKGEEVERQSRKINIYNINVIDIIDNRKILFEVECSKGTYVRTLCNDIGCKLGTYGYMSYLIRTKVGSFNIKDCVSLESIERGKIKDKIDDIIMPMDCALNNYPCVQISDKFFTKISNGALVLVNDMQNKDDMQNKKYRVYCKDLFIGIGRVSNKYGDYYLKMDKVLL